MVLEERRRRRKWLELSNLLDELETLAHGYVEAGSPTTPRRAAGAASPGDRPRSAATSETPTEMSLDTWKYITPDSDFNSVSIPSVTYETVSSDEVSAAMAEIDDTLAEMWWRYNHAASSSESVIEEECSSISSGFQEGSGSRRTTSSGRLSSRHQQTYARRETKDKATQTSLQERVTSGKPPNKPLSAPAALSCQQNKRCVWWKEGTVEQRQTRTAPQPRCYVASSAINRERMCRRIKEENQCLSKRLASVKPVVSCWTY